jgi:hypothetical protein
LKQEQIAAEQKFQEARAKAVEDGDKAEIARLEAIKKLRDAEFSARESNLMTEGDANVTTRDEAVEDAELKRQDALAKAQGATAEAALDAEQKTREAVGLTNEAYLERLRLLQQMPGGAVPPVAAAPTSSTAVSAPGATPEGLAATAGPGAKLSVEDASLIEAALRIVVGLGRVENAVKGIGRQGTVGGLG